MPIWFLSALNFLSALICFAIVFALPVFLFRWLNRRGIKPGIFCYFGSVIVVWFSLIFHVWIVDRPIASAYESAKGNDMYDGVGANVVMLGMGWLPGMYGSALGLGIFRWQEKRKQRKQALQENVAKVI